MGWLRSVLIPLVCAAGLAALAQAPAASFGAFWESVRQAVRAGDADKLAAITQFPLAVHGPLDVDKIRRVDPTQFKKSLPQWLAQDTGMSAQPESLRDFILRTDAAAIAARTRGRRGSANSLRVGGFHFEHQPAGWRLTRVYEER